MVEDMGNITVMANLAYAKVRETHAELVRVESRTGGDWARDGFSLQAAQAVCEKARKDYDDAFSAYAQNV